MKNLRMDNKSMMVRLAVLLVVDGVILLIWGLISPSEPVIESEDVMGIGPVPIKVCSEDSTSSFMIIGVYLYKIVLTLLMCYMGFKTRKVSADYSEAKYIFMSSHELLFCGIVIIPLVHTVTNDIPLVKYILQSVGLTVVTAVCILLVVGSKIRYAMLKTTASVAAETVAGTKTGTQDGMTSNMKYSASDGEEVAELKQEISELREKNAALKEQVDGFRSRPNAS